MEGRYGYWRIFRYWKAGVSFFMAELILFMFVYHFSARDLNIRGAKGTFLQFCICIFGFTLFFDFSLYVMPISSTWP